MSKAIIRVFPRQTAWTPRDALAIVGNPPFLGILPEEACVMISVTFTWEIGLAWRLKKAWSVYYDDVRIGGPAFGSDNHDFTPGRFIAGGVTFTSRGCPKQCRWCLVRQREGALYEMPAIHPGHIIQDNNLLACSRGHFERVCEMLQTQRRIQFKGGLDIDYLDAWHVERIKPLSVDELWVACDRDEDISRLDKASDLLGDFSIEKKRCYALGGFDGDTPEAATARCEAILAKGFLPFAQYYKSPEAERWIPSGPWTAWARKWARPAAYRSRKARDAGIGYLFTSDGV